MQSANDETGIWDSAASRLPIAANTRLSLRFLVTLLLVICGCSKSSVDPAPTAVASISPQASHERMLQVLSEINLRTNVENEYLGDGPVRQLEHELANLPEGIPLEQLRCRWQLAEAQLRIGQTEEAIKQFQQCTNLVSALAWPAAEAQQLRDRLDFQLAVAYLRLAENQNCLHCLHEDCCIFPIRPGGVHVNKEPAEAAIGLLTKYLEHQADNPSAKWLLNVAYMTVGRYPEGVPARWLADPELFASKEEFPRFRNIAPSLGLNHVSLCGGMIVEDLNNDGWLDVMTSDWNTSGEIRCQLSKGDGTFRNATTEAGLQGIFGGLNMLQADYDNDGDIDIFVLRGAWLDQAGRHPNSLLQNDGEGRFRDVTFSVGMGENHYPTQTASWADYDNDGDLDLYVGNEIGPSELFQNDGRGHFRNVAFAAGVANGGSPKGVIWGDYDNDRFPDLFVSNLTGPNRLFHNNGDGTFTNVAAEAHVDGPQRSFPTWFWDFNNDGALDIFVAAYWSDVNHFAADFLAQEHPAETDRLYQGDGKGSFRDVTQEANLQHVTLPMGSNFGDVDSDGYPDFYLGTGYPDYEGIMPNRMFYNQQGKRFSDVTEAAGLGHLQKGHAVAFADFDHDGDQDIFIEMGGAFPGDAFADAVFQNPGFGNHSITVKLVGNKSNRSAIGARIQATIREDDKHRSIYKWVNSGGSFGCSPLRQQIGLGKAEVIDVLEIYWPTSDTTQTFEQVAADQMIEVREGARQFTPLAVKGG